jgi:prepilin-type N-terminal cleavage/methylation domain-containing protein
MKYKGVVDVNKKGNKKGFTLVEIIVVLVILAILAAIAVPSVLGYVEQAKESEQLYKVRDALIASQTRSVLELMGLMVNLVMIMALKMEIKN